MKLQSSAFEHEGLIPRRYACDGEQVNPPLDFLDVPAGTKSLALIMEDPDVPRTLRPDGMFDHWIVWNIPSSTKGIPEKSVAPGTTGLNTRGTMEYVPPCPPDREHRYYFRLYALDSMVQLSPTSGKQDLLAALNGHVIDQAELMGRYDRQNRQGQA